jgi:hypothetical protein
LKEGILVDAHAGDAIVAADEGGSEGGCEMAKRGRLISFIMKVVENGSWVMDWSLLSVRLLDFLGR